jgi:TrpR-related protein YerC/YecD
MKKPHPASPSVAKQAEEQLYEAILSLKNTEEAREFFEDLCTPTELRAMADRWRVIDSIVKKIPYRTIAEETGVSVTTIGRVARCLEMGTGGYRRIFERLKRQK